MATTNIAYFEFKSGGSDKFYLMEQDPNGTSFTARYGRCGTTGSVATYPMSKWNSVYNTRVRHGYTDKTKEYLAGHAGTQQSQPQPDGKRVPLFEETQRSVCLQPVMVIVWSVMMLLLICTQISQIVLRLQKTALLASALLYAVTHMFHEFYPNK